MLQLPPRSRCCRQGGAGHEARTRVQHERSPGQAPTGALTQPCSRHHDAPMCAAQSQRTAILGYAPPCRPVPPPGGPKGCGVRCAQGAQASTSARANSGHREGGSLRPCPEATHLSEYQMKGGKTEDKV